MAELKQIPADRIIKGNTELAKKIGVSVFTISRWKNKGILNYKDINGVIFYDCENLFDEKTSKSKSKRKQNS